MSKNDANEPAGPDLDRLYAGREPAAGLEERVVGALRAEGAIRGERGPGPERSGRVRALRAEVGRGGPRPPRGPLRSRTGLVAAGLALFVAGSLVGRATTRVTEAVAPVTGEPFMLLLWEDDRFSAGQTEAVAEEYASWAEAVAGGGWAISGDELGPSRTIGVSDDRSSTSQARIGGYFLVRAENAEAADRLARDHPHVDHGGWIEVAPIVQR